MSATCPSPPSACTSGCGERRDDGGTVDPRRRARATAPAAPSAPASASLARAVQPRHARGRPVGQEDAQRDEVRQHRRGQRQRRELRRAEVADDRGVDQQVQRLGRERPEGGQREAQDLAVVGGAAHAGPLYDPAMVRVLALLAAASLGGLRRGSGDAARRGVRERPGAIERALRPRARPGDACPGHAAVGVRLATRAATPTCRPRARSSRARPTTSPRRRASAATRKPRCGLGYLVGAARRGAKRTAGHPRRAAAPRRALGARCSTARAPRVAAALARGQRAGEATG